MAKEITGLDYAAFVVFRACGILCIWPVTVEAGPARIVAGPDAGLAGATRMFTGVSLAPVSTVYAYGPAFTGGVRVGCGDVDGDGKADVVTGSGPGAGNVKVFSGGTQDILSILPYGSIFAGGVFVAAGDVDGDGRADIITGPDQGTVPHVKVFSGATGSEIRSFFAFSPGFAGGVRVAGGDVNGDGFADLVTGCGPGSGALKVFSGATGSELHSLFPFGPGFTGGIHVASADVNGDGRADMVIGAGNTNSQVLVLDGTTGFQITSVFTFAGTAVAGVRVASADVDGDGRAEILAVPGPGGEPEVRVFDGNTGVFRGSFYNARPSDSSGVFIAASPLVRPKLEILREASNTMKLRWDAGFTSELQDSTSLQAPWTAVPVLPQQVGKHLESIVPAPLPSNFFKVAYDEESP